MRFKPFLSFAVSLLVSGIAYAQDTCDTAALEQCQASCVSAQPACSSVPPLTIADVRAIIAEKCGCTVTPGANEGDPDFCLCTDKAKNYGSYRSCVAQLSESLKTFKLSSETARNQLKADNTLCKSVINSNKDKGGSGKGGKNK